MLVLLAGWTMAGAACSSPPVQTDSVAAEPAAEMASPRVYSEAEFRDLIAGKSREEILALLGKPLAVYDGVPDGAKSYNYSPEMTWMGRVQFRVKDDVTGIEYKFVTVHFGPGGVVTGVNF